MNKIFEGYDDEENVNPEKKKKMSTQGLSDNDKEELKKLINIKPSLSSPPPTDIPLTHKNNSQKLKNLFYAIGDLLGDL